MKNKLYSIILAASLISVNAFAVTSMERNEIAKEIKKELSEIETNQGKFDFYHYIGRKLIKEEEYSLSEKYLREGLDLKGEFDKGLILTGLIELFQKQKKYKKGKKEINNTLKYYKKNPKFKNSKFLHFVAFYQTRHPAYIKTKISTKGLKTSILNAVNEHNYQVLFRKGKYKKAFSKLNKKLIKKLDTMHTQVEYDLLSALVKKNFKRKLLCEKNFKKANASLNYTWQTCKILVDLKKKKKLSKKDFLNLKKHIVQLNPGKDYIYLAIQRL